jgi:putative N6-adenine-specific DNA methylase
LGDIMIRCEDFRKWTPEPELQPSIVVTNAPYGQRIGGDKTTNLQPLYRSLGDFMKQKTRKPGSGWVLTGDIQLSRGTHIALQR